MESGSRRGKVTPVGVVELCALCTGLCSVVRFMVPASKQRAFQAKLVDACATLPALLRRCAHALCGTRVAAAEVEGAVTDVASSAGGLNEYELGVLVDSGELATQAASVAEARRAELDIDDEPAVPVQWFDEGTRYEIGSSGGLVTPPLPVADLDAHLGLGTAAAAAAATAAIVDGEESLSSGSSRARPVVLGEIEQPQPSIVISDVPSIGVLRRTSAL